MYKCDHSIEQWMQIAKIYQLSKGLIRAIVNLLLMKIG